MRVHLQSHEFIPVYIPPVTSMWSYTLQLPYGTKILHGIKFYGFTAVGRTVKLKSINFYYCIAKILSCFDNRKI